MDKKHDDPAGDNLLASIIAIYTETMQTQNEAVEKLLSSDNMITLFDDIEPTAKDAEKLERSLSGLTCACGIPSFRDELRCRNAMVAEATLKAIEGLTTIKYFQHRGFPGYEDWRKRKKQIKNPQILADIADYEQWIKDNGKENS